MVQPDSEWPNFLKRMSATIGDGASPQPAPGQDRPLPPPLPARRNQQLYQPQGLEASTTSLTTGLQDITLDFGGSASPLREDAPRPSSDSATRSFAGPDPLADDRPPTTERVAEFRLDIPDGVRNMTQHPGDVIVGSVVVTVTKPTPAQRITLVFVGQQRVYIKDTSGASALSLYTNVDHTMFDKRLALWGRPVDAGPGGAPETLPAGTQRIPFSIQLPRVNYPATINRERACRVRYQVWAVLERSGTFIDHTTATHREEICFEPLAYPPRPREVLPINESVVGDYTATTRHIAVQVTGGLLKMPAEAGERIAYQIEARTARGPSAAAAGAADPYPMDPEQFDVRHVRLTVVERLTARGLIKGREQAQGYRRDMHTVKLVPEGAEAGKTSNRARVFASSGDLRLPLDMCPFDSKHLKRTYELRVDCEVVDNQSL
ncbi:hypothetical protein IWQ57_005973, partial [Coemansia nantahalensis]